MFRIVLSRITFLLLVIIASVIIFLEYKFELINIDIKIFVLLISLTFLILNLFIKGFMFNKKSLFWLGSFSLLILVISLFYYFM